MNVRQFPQAILTIALAVFSTASPAIGLFEAYQAARQNDPAFRAARHERDAGQYAIDLGWSGLLPTVAITGSWSTNRGERRYTQGLASNVTQDLDYRDRSLALTLRQPLFNYEAIVRYRQGYIQAAYSDAVFEKKEAELAMRLVSAYFEALLAMDKLALNEAEALARQTNYPHLLFPALATEKIQTVEAWNERQQTVREASPAFVLAA